MQSSKSRGRVLVVGVLIATAGFPVAALPAAGAGPPPPALVSVHEAGIDFLPGAGYRRAVLEVSGPEVELRRTYQAFETPAIGRFDARGEPLPNGTYTWRLSLIPDEAAARALRADVGKERGSDRGEAPGAWQAQSGSFTIVDGSFADPGLVEPTARRPAASASKAVSTAVPAGAGSARPASDADASVAAGSCEGDARLAGETIVASPPYGAGLTAADAGSGPDTDTAILGGALAELAVSGASDAPEMAASPVTGGTGGTGAANGRGPVRNEE